MTGEAWGLRGRLTLVPMSRDWLNEQATRYHYMHRAVHARACPFGWAVQLDGNLTRPTGEPYGFIMFASVHFTKLRGEFGYPGLPTHWQVLSLARLWLHDDCPRFSETVVMGKALRLAPRRWLEVHPPRDESQPYEISKIVSFADETAGFKGTIYKAANFRDTGLTVSRPRHKATRGAAASGHTLRRFIYDVPARALTPTAVQLALFGNDQELPGAIPYFLAQVSRLRLRKEQAIHGHSLRFPVRLALAQPQPGAH